MLSVKRQSIYALFFVSLTFFLSFYQRIKLNEVDELRLPEFDLSSPDLNLLRTAAQNFGALTILGSGFNSEVKLNALKAASVLFSLDPSVKVSRRAISNNGGTRRGYLLVGEESGSVTQTEQKEGFSYGFNWTGIDAKPTNGLQARNIWPSPSEGFSKADRRILQDLFFSLVNVAAKMLEALSQSLDLKAEQSLQCEERISLLRIFHYLGTSSSECVPHCTGSSAHTDWGLVTLIIQEPGMPGLEFEHEGKWKPVRDGPPGSLFLNFGDFLAMQGGVKSPRHRVRLVEGVDRLSFVFFGFPPFGTPVVSSGANKGLSLFENQGSGSGCQADGSFGEWMQCKWMSVAREIRDNAEV